MTLSQYGKIKPEVHFSYLTSINKKANKQEHNFFFKLNFVYPSDPNNTFNILIHRIEMVALVRCYKESFSPSTPPLTLTYGCDAVRRSSS